MLPLSHAEVVYGKKSLINKMAGDEWQKFANLRSLYLYMYTFSGTKLIFMGGEFGQLAEWNVNQSLDWHLITSPEHRGLMTYVKSLNSLYRTEPALYEKAFSHEGFEWLEMGDTQHSVIAYIRKGHDRYSDLVVVLNLTPVPRENYRIGVPSAGNWEVIFNSDDISYHGSGMMSGNVKSEKKHWKNKAYSVALTLPPLGGLILKLTT